MPSVFTIKGPASSRSDCVVVGGDDPKVRKAAKQVHKICERIRHKLEPLGVDVVLGGSFRSGLAIPPEGGHDYDIDLRFLFDGNRKAMIPQIERATGLKYKKAVRFDDARKPVYKFSGRVTSDGVPFDVDGDLRDTTYFGWQRLYPKVLSPEELRTARRAKIFLRKLPDDRKAYKAFKQGLIKEVMQRARSQGLAGGPLMGRKMIGRFCERTAAPKSRFDPRSFRYKKSGSSWILIGCPRGQWQPRKERCKVGTRAHKILRNVCPTCRCKRGEKQKTKGR